MASFFEDAALAKDGIHFWVRCWFGVSVRLDAMRRCGRSCCYLGGLFRGNKVASASAHEHKSEKPRQLANSNTAYKQNGVGPAKIQRERAAPGRLAGLVRHWFRSTYGRRSHSLWLLRCNWLLCWVPAAVVVFPGQVFLRDALEQTVVARGRVAATHWRELGHWGQLWHTLGISCAAQVFVHGLRT